MKDKNFKEYFFFFLAIFFLVIFCFITSEWSNLQWSNVAEEIIAGIVGSIMVGIILYFIFDKIIIKRPKVRLHISPSELNLENDRSEFELEFYLHNIGDFVAKHILFTAEFPDLDIIRLVKKDEKQRLKRIDKHRGGRPSIQHYYPESKGVLHPYSRIRNVYFGKIVARLNKATNEIKIKYDINAENMIFFEDIYKIKVNLKRK
jgi:hypothetical protein